MKVYVDTFHNEDGSFRGNLFLESDSMQFILREYREQRLDKHGKETQTVLNVGYFTNIVSALNHVIKMKVMQSTAQTLTELREDIQRIESDINLGFDWNAVMPLERVDNEEVPA